MGVRADHPEHRRVRGEFPQVPGNVGRAAGVLRLAVNFDYRHRGFRRDAADAPPDELVQDQVADYQDAGSGEGGEDLLVTGAVHSGGE